MKQQHTVQRFRPMVIGTIIAALPGLAFASGFQLSEYSAESLGRANSGGAAMADDATAVAWNPANLVLIDDPEVVFSSAVIRLGADFTKISATDAIGQPLSGNEGGSVGKLGMVPGAFYAERINDRMVWGISMTAPFGLSTTYDAGSIFRYQAYYSRVAVMQLNPSIGISLSDNLSVGFGLDVQYMTVKLTSGIDFGTVCFAQVDPLTCTGLGLSPQNNDGFAELAGDSMGFGMNFGATYHYDNGRFGIAYRSAVEHQLEGDGKFFNVPSIFLAQGVFTNSAMKGDFSTPDLLSISWYHEINENWRISADYSRTGWGTFEELRIRYDNPLQPDTVEEEGWEDVARYALGVDYTMSDTFTLRAGVAFDRSPIPDPTPFAATTPSVGASRTARLPGADRWWVAFGATYNMDENTQVSVAWDHLFLDDDIPFDHGGSLGDRVIGTFEADADILSFQLSHQF
jgi:long-chain fatty acid transport protein